MEIGTMSKEITVREAAQRLGCTLHHAYALVYANRLPSRKVENRWLIPLAAVERRIKLRAKRGIARENLAVRRKAG
jgi:excisionase family DNA binding protein